MAQSEIKIENDFPEADYEGMPLKQRLKMLLATRRISFDTEIQLQIPANLVEAVVEKRGNESSPSQSCCSAKEKVTDTISGIEKNAGKTVECNNHENLEHKCLDSNQTTAATATTAATMTSAGVDSVDNSSVHGSLALKYPVKFKVEHGDNDFENSSTDSMKDSSGVGIQAFHSESEMRVEYLDELDHVPFKERLMTLLKSKSLGSAEMTRKVNFSGVPSHSQSIGIGQGEMKLGDQSLPVCGNQINEVDRTSKPGSSKRIMNTSCKTLQEQRPCFEGIRNRSAAAGQCGVKRNDRAHSFENNWSKYESTGRDDTLYGDTKTLQHIPILNLTKIKVEPPHNYEFQSLDAINESHTFSENMVLVKTEVEYRDDSHEDMLDHMLLRQRMKLFSSRDDPCLKVQGSECMGKILPSALDCRPVESRPALSLKVNRPRKRRKTATDSVETAMEEDAPGLLQVLIDKGVSVDELRLYGQPEINEALEDSSSEDNFAELESVIEKLFSQRESLLKLGSLKGSKGEKASYCLECLFSLVEQARYLQFRNWPVEWGWCRDLQSFIFVFQRHNRIVLERPEYGYATYFFELADSVPIEWQVRRLITAMKLSSCSRITLIENRALMVGDDLSEGEAKVLMDYGWTPNTGLGTMLNYYDRVYHDRNNEKYSSEWRSKIGKLLVEGFNGGTLVSAVIPSKVMEYNVANPQQVKMELS